MTGPRQVICFDDCMIDVACRDLVVRGETRRVEPQVFDLILYLILNRDRVVSRDELFESIWTNRIVSNATLSSRVKTARQLMLDNGRDQSVIRTYRGYGFRFVAPVLFSDGPPEDARFREGGGSPNSVLLRHGG